MKNKILYILRHGETDFNKRQLVQGRGINASLNAKGRKQARCVYKHFKRYNFDHIYTSTLVRTVQTVALFPANIPRTALAGLDEISWGNMEGVKASIKEQNFYKETVLAWQKGNLDLNVGGGESPRQVVERQKETMKIIMGSKYQLILICMHGRALRILLTWLLNYDLRQMDRFPHQNGCYYSLMWDGRDFTLKDFNVTDHLR